MSRFYFFPLRLVFTLSRFALGLVAFTGGALAPAHAQTIDVCVDFGGFSSIIPDKIGFLARVQAYFVNACYPDPLDPTSTLCLGPSESTGVNFLEGASGTSGCDIQATFICDASLPFYGDMDKFNHTLRVNLYPFIGLFAGDPDPVGRRMQAIAETLAHEVGHDLCAVHECVGPQ